MTPTFENRLARNWGWFLFRGGIAGVFFLALAFLRPINTVASLAGAAGAFLLFNGLCMAIQGALASSQEDKTGWTLLLCAGLLTVAMGIFSLQERSLPLTQLLWCWAAWGFIVGMLETISGIRLQTETDEWLLIVSGLISMSFGFSIGTIPFLGINILLWCWATFAISYGIALAWLSRRLFIWLHALPPGPEPQEQPAVDQAGALHPIQAQVPGNAGAPYPVQAEAPR
ncbi:MAG TPA: hypothetical protein VGO93_27480 [Candidatus Xenobia bacterium]|jgi:uncharacterized membrane protein HdeD (DUF308 family)